MKTNLKSAFICAGIAAVVAVQTQNIFAATIIERGARVAIIGDSITEQKLYSKYIEAYLLACSGVEEVRVFQYGWGGETAAGFAGRLENDLAGFKPTVATLCYGMNDGQYRPYNDDIGRNYETNMRRVIEGLKKIGVKTIIIGSPGAVDTKYFVRNNFAPLSGADGYNQNLAKLRDICKKLAQEYNQPFADVHQPLIDAMKAAKAKMGDDYDVCGRDGIHPGPNGHLVMAYAFLKAMGFDGNIGEITVDLNGKATATGGHKIISATGGSVEIQSLKYPFCFDPDPVSSSSTRSILPFCPFNQDLNRLTLKVANLSKPRARVKWGDQTKEFTKEQLQSGINLAAEFSQTPFDRQFNALLKAISTKQNFETVLIKNLITNFRHFPNEKADPEVARAFDTLTTKLMMKEAQLHADVVKQITPVNHRIEITPID
ncbi:MAG: SGNH/GDSL hydrolase family protein [Verrucomicrobiia bacterium]